jgi:hypothetical protein
VARSCAVSCWRWGACGCVWSSVCVGGGAVVCGLLSALGGRGCVWSSVCVGGCAVVRGLPSVSAVARCASEAFGNAHESLHAQGGVRVCVPVRHTNPRSSPHGRAVATADPRIVQKERRHRHTPPPPPSPDNQPSATRPDRKAGGAPPRVERHRGRSATASGAPPRAERHREWSATASGAPPRAECHRGRSATAGGVPPRAECHPRGGVPPRAERHPERSATPSGAPPRAERHPERSAHPGRSATHRLQPPEPLD